MQVKSQMKIIHYVSALFFILSFFSCIQESTRNDTNDTRSTTTNTELLWKYENLCMAYHYLPTFSDLNATIASEDLFMDKAYALTFDGSNMMLYPFMTPYSLSDQYSGLGYMEFNILADRDIESLFTAEEKAEMGLIDLEFRMIFKEELGITFDVPLASDDFRDLDIYAQVYELPTVPDEIILGQDVGFSGSIRVILEEPAEETPWYGVVTFDLSDIVFEVESQTRAQLKSIYVINSECVMSENNCREPFSGFKQIPYMDRDQWVECWGENLILSLELEGSLVCDEESECLVTYYQ